MKKRNIELNFKRRNVVGKLINFRGLVYAPVEENGVIFLFSKLNADLNLNVETIRKGFPDCIAKRKIGNDLWEELNIEFEYKSSHFKAHGHLELMAKGVKCDMIVCWEHDWPECPKEIEILELKSEYLKFEDDLTAEPEAKAKVKNEKNEAIFGKFKESAVLYEKFQKSIHTIDKTLWSKPAKRKVFYYSPERVFFNVAIQKQGLNLTLFTGGKRIKGVEAVTQADNYAQKWGVFYVITPSDIVKAKSVLKTSLHRIREAIKKNENTGWYAEVD